MQPSTFTNPVRTEDLKREVYGVLGIPIDVVDLATALRRITSAAHGAVAFLLSTPNLNFLLASQTDASFRESLLLSDLCTADGMPIVWIARLLGIPIKERVAGSDIFEALKSTKYSAEPLSVFLFGGEEGVAAIACKELNAQATQIKCVGAFYPGFCSVDEMSTDIVLNHINSSNADFLLTALGARKGQAWLLRNHSRIQIPVRVHLGATINFQAKTIKRAPAIIGKWGLEWLWRIMQEPQLWRRYWSDGFGFLRLMFTRIVPLIVFSRWYRLRSRGKEHNLQISRTENHKFVILAINGSAIAQTVGNALPHVEDVARAAKDVIINFADTRLIDARFLGLLIMLNKILTRQKLRLTFTGISPRIERLFHLNGFGFLLRD